MYEHTVGVPLIMAGPGISAGETCPAQLYLRDLYPTVCELAGIAIPDVLEGKSIVPVLRGESEAIHPHVLCYFRDSQRMIRDDRWKLIFYPHLDRYQLFDLKNDPHERQDLSEQAEYAGERLRLEQLLLGERRRMGDPLLKEKAER
jgi:arylsulfatase A-like enzyme